MASRPYFKHGIEQIQALVTSSRSDLKALKVIQYELGFRDRPKARALKAEVDELVRQLSAGSIAPERVVVECANCKTPNFVSILDGVVQHLSCSACKSPYEAQFKYGVMRTTFQAKSGTESSGSAVKWLIIGLVVLVVIALMAK